MVSTYSAREGGRCTDCGRLYDRGAEVGDLRGFSGPVCYSCWEDAPEAERE